MAEPLKIAVAGAGYFSRFHTDAWSRMDGVVLAAICDRDVGRAKAVAEKHSVEQVHEDVAAMLDAVQPDVLDIATPPESHIGIIRLAMQRGIHVICQKPFCETREQASEAVALAKRAERIIAVNENFRFQPWYRTAKLLLEADVLGQVYSCVFRFRPGDGQGDDAYKDSQPYFRSMERFLVHETSIHWVDTFQYLFGDISGVMADLVRLNPVIKGEDAGVILFEFASGMRATFDGNRLLDHAAENRRLTMGEMLIEGTAGSLRLDGDGRLWRRRHKEFKEIAVPFEWNNQGFGGDCVYNLFRHVIDHLTKGTGLENSAAEYQRTQEIEDAIYTSNGLRGWVKTI